MQNKRRIFAAFAASALALSLLAGCGTKDTPTTPETPPATSDPVAPPTTEQPATPDAAAGDQSINDLRGVIGMPDGEVTAQLGDGTPSKADETLIAREYTRDVLGESATVSVIYDDNQAANRVDVIFATTTFDSALEQLTAAYGAPADHQQSEESGGQNAVWNLDGCSITLIEAYGSVSLSIAAA